jgi:redox-sensitive bicupin YhaK (pirin superfamily)
MRTVLHPAASRGIADHGWLQSRFSFSFAEWYEPTRMGFGALRVINDDRIAPHSGFGRHTHRDMEIITIVLSGAVTHGDSMGNEGVVAAGEVQVMTAGTGVAHSEFNRHDAPLELFQIWILPRIRGLAPRYDQRAFAVPAEGTAQLLVSSDGADGSLLIHQEATIRRAAIAPGATLEFALRGKGRGAYVFLISGEATVAGERLASRDAVGVWDADTFSVAASTAVDALIIEVPMLGE